VSLTDTHSIFRKVRCCSIFLPLLCIISLPAREGRANPPKEKNSGTTQNEPRTAPRQLMDLESRAVDPFQATNVKARVFIFLSNECPIANRYAPEIRRLYRQFAGIPFWLVHADPDEAPDAIARHMKEYGFTCGVLRDPQHVLVKRAKVRVTPEAAVFGRDGQLLYHGRIDNWYVDFGKARIAATQHDLQTVLEAVVEGKPVHPKSTRAIGCYIPEPGLKSID
jgi:hypothetical protein